MSVGRDRALKKPEVAALLRLTVRQVERLVAAGELRSQREGGRAVFPLADLAAYLAARKQRQAAERPTVGLAEARRRRELAIAETRELQLGRLRKSLIELKPAQDAIEDLIVRLRQAVMSGPNRYAHRLVCACRPHGEASVLLDDVLRAVLGDADDLLRTSGTMLRFLEMGVWDATEDETENAPERDGGVATPAGRNRARRVRPAAADGHGSSRAHARAHRRRARGPGPAAAPGGEPSPAEREG